MYLSPTLSNAGGYQPLLLVRGVTFLFTLTINQNGGINTPVDLTGATVSAVITTTVGDPITLSTSISAPTTGVVNVSLDAKLVLILRLL